MLPFRITGTRSNKHGGIGIIFASILACLECPRAAPIVQRPGRVTLGRFLRDVRGGATGIVAGAVTVMSVGATAFIVDHNWLVDQRDVLKRASDAAAVAATIELKRLPPSTTDDALHDALLRVAQNYVTLNLQYLQGERLERAKESLSVEVTPHRSLSTVDVVARADLGGTLFSKHLPLAGNYSGPEEIATVAKVESLTNAVEVVLAIDVSTSMERDLRGNVRPAGHTDSRMEIVKQAAATLVDTLNPHDENRVAVGVVPWQIVVRLDEDARHTWTANGWAQYPQSRRYAAAYACRPQGSCTTLDEVQSLASDPDEAWHGCLDEHRISGGRAALPPTDADLIALPSESAFAQAFAPALWGTAYQCLGPPLPSNYYYQICYDEVSAAAVDRIAAAPQRDCGNGVSAIQPLTSDRTVIDTAIDDLTPVGRYTYSTLGILWGQRLLSHSWKTVWGGNVHPVDPASEVNAGTRKAIVLLTDGEDNQCGADPSCSNSGLGISRATACSEAKAAGIEIFVVAAMAPRHVSSALETALRACSSEADNSDGTYAFVNNSDAQGLEAAFTDIAQQLQVVRRVF